jgi:shikimate kinase
MKRVLITGMSGTGKSSVIQELLARGYLAYDLDAPEWSEWIDADPSDVLTPTQGKDWVWREDRVRALLSEPQDGMLFISGCAENMKKFFQLIDAVILLSAPVQTIMERLATPLLRTRPLSSAIKPIV